MTNPDKRGLLATLGLGALLVLCCAAPVLLAAGVLGALGAWLANPWVIGAAALAVVAVIGLVWQRHRREGTTGNDCCPPQQRDRGQRPTSRPPNREE